jgi:arsenite-transporting ATPase
MTARFTAHNAWTNFDATGPSDWSTPFLFFTGKGGVGKTTVASAIAVRLAEAGRKVLVVSTDPASNLDDVFEMTAGPIATPVPAVPGLSLMNLDPEASAAAYRERVVGPYRGVLPPAAIRSMEEQLSGACTVEIAAFNEFTGLLATPTVSGQFDTVVFDTAPTGHTLRLLSLPKAWSGFIADATHGASCLGPLAGLEAQREQYAAAVTALADASKTMVVLVSRPEASALSEAARAGRELRALGIGHQRLVVNGVLSDPDDDRVARALAERQAKALTAMPTDLQGIPTVVVPLIPVSLTGVAALRRFARDAGDLPTDPSRDEPIALPDLADLITRLAQPGRGIIMTMGKGGVGKTSLAIAIARGLATAGHRVHLSTTDPAADLLQQLGAERPAELSADVIDPETETRRYTEEVLGLAGELDVEGRALLEEDLRSPCTEEIAVFRAFARTVARADAGFVVLDTAPTGHTLLLLDAAESYHREVARTTGQVPEAVRALLPRLRDPAYTKVLIVALAETTPVAEAARLQADLQRAGIEPYGWVINASLAASGTRHPVLARRAALERPEIERVAGALATRTWLVPWRPSRESTSTIEGTGRAVSLANAIDLEPSHG